MAPNESEKISVKPGVVAIATVNNKLMLIKKSRVILDDTEAQTKK